MHLPVQLLSITCMLPVKQLPRLEMQTCTYVPSGSKVQNVRIEHSKVRGPVRLKQLPADALLAPTF